MLKNTSQSWVRWQTPLSSAGTSLNLCVKCQPVLQSKFHSSQGHREPLSQENKTKQQKPKLIPPPNQIRTKHPHIALVDNWRGVLSNCVRSPTPLQTLPHTYAMHICTQEHTSNLFIFYFFINNLNTAPGDKIP